MTMPILSDATQQELKKRFDESLEGKVKIVLFTKPDSPLIIPGRECATCKETGQLLREVASVSEKIELEEHDFFSETDAARERGIDRIPAFDLEGAAKGRVRYLGIPAGHEFPSLVEDIIDVSKGSTSLADETRERLAGLEKDVHIQVFVTPT